MWTEGFKNNNTKNSVGEVTADTEVSPIRQANLMRLSPFWEAVRQTLSVYDVENLDEEKTSTLLQT